MELYRAEESQKVLIIVDDAVLFRYIFVIHSVSDDTKKHTESQRTERRSTHGKITAPVLGGAI